MGGHKPPEGVSPSKAIAAQSAPVVAGFEMDAIVVTIEIRLSLELLGALLATDLCCAWMRILALRIVSFQVRFPVVAPLEELAAGVALVSSFRSSSPLALLLDAIDTWEGGRSRVEPGARLVVGNIVEVDRI